MNVVVDVRNASVIAHWMIECDKRSGRDESGEFEEVEMYALRLLQGRMADFLEIPGRAFMGILYQNAPMRYPVAYPFALVSDGMDCLRDLFREGFERTRKRGARRIRIATSNERLLRFCTKMFDFRTVETVGELTRRIR